MECSYFSKSILWASHIKSYLSLRVKKNVPTITFLYRLSFKRSICIVYLKHCVCNIVFIKTSIEQQVSSVSTVLFN